MMNTEKWIKDVVMSNHLSSMVSDDVLDAVAGSPLAGRNQQRPSAFENRESSRRTAQLGEYLKNE